MASATDDRWVTPDTGLIIPPTINQQIGSNQGGGSSSLIELCGAIETAIKISTSTTVTLDITSKLLNDYAATQFRDDLKIILEDQAALGAIAPRSYFHANGFSKFVLYESNLVKVRLHEWEPGVHSEENIHEHRWSFASTILCGRLRTEWYEESLGGGHASYPEYRYHAAGTGIMDVEHVGAVSLVKTSETIHVAGESYITKPGTLHRIKTNSGETTATLVCQCGAARDWNRLITTKDLQPDTERRYFTVGHARHKLQSFLAHL